MDKVHQWWPKTMVLMIEQMIRKQNNHVFSLTIEVVHMTEKLTLFKFYLRKVQAKNKNTYTTSDVRSSSVQVGCNRTVGIVGTRREPPTHPSTRATNLQC